jgi:cysteine desulfurase/selenocysteine lyase
MTVQTTPASSGEGQVSGDRLFRDHIERFNAGVRSGDFGPMIRAFAEDAVFTFEGRPIPPLRGRAAIEAGYRDFPPDDEIEVTSTTEPDATTVVARFRWVREGDTGTITMGHRGSRLESITVGFDEPDSAATAEGGAVKGGDAARIAHGRLDPEVIRRDFPILATRTSRGEPLVYLDSASTSQKPRAVIDAVNEFNSAYNANVHRGIYEIGERATAAYERARASVARFINAPDAHEVVFVRNATEAINLVAYSWGRRNIGRGDAIVLTEMEHHANLVPWQLLVQEMDGDLEFIPITDEGVLRLDVFEVLLRLKPKLVAFTHVSNTLGTINPVAEMTKMAHDAGALVLVDGAQAVPHVPVDVQAIGADFYAFSGHKMLGPTGSGALWARRELLEAMPPFLAGGEMIREVHLRRSEFNAIPWKFEAGTPDIAAEIGLGAAADYLAALGMGRVRDHERELLVYAFEAFAREHPDVTLYGPLDPDARGGVIPFNVPNVHPHDVAQVLDRLGVAVRAGHHCTMPLHERLELPATARASFNVYTTHADVDALMAGLAEVKRVFA